MAKFKIVKDIVLEYIRQGFTQDMAAQLSGINAETITAWKNTKPDFSKALYKAELKAKSFHIKNIIDAAKGKGYFSEKGPDPHWSEKFLIMRFPHEFSPRRVLKVEGGVNINAEVSFNDFSDEQVERILSIMAEKKKK